MTFPTGALSRARLAVCTSLALCLWGSHTYAGEHAPLTLEHLLQIEVTGASRFAQSSREAPSAVTVITREQIRDHAWHTLADLLDAVPGLFVTTDRMYRYLGVRGFLQPSDYNTNILLLIDGIAANDALYSQAFLGTEGLLDMALIERVEFIPGPGASVYGSNAILGVINVVTATGRSLRGTTLEATAANHNGRGAAVRHGYADDRHDFLISASTWHSDGENVALPDTDDVAFGRTRGLERERAQRLMLRHAWDNFVLLGAWSERRKGYATAPYGTLFGDSRTATRDGQTLIALTHDAEWWPGLNLRSRASVGGAQYRGEWAYALPDGLNRDESDSRWWGVDVQATDTRLDGHTLIYGIEYRDELRLHQRNIDLDAEPNFVRLDDRRKARHLGLYVQDEWGDNDWRFNAGLRVDHYSSFGATINPRLGLVQLLTPQTTVKYLLGTAYRAPNVFEMYYHDSDATMKANPALRPEHIRSLEMVVEHEDARGWQWTGSIFHKRIRNPIAQALDPDDGLLEYRNLAPVNVRGVVLSLRRQWHDGTRVALSSSLHAARRASDGKRLTHTPRHVAKLDATIPFGRWRATFEGRHLGARDTGSDRRIGAQTWGNVALVSTHALLGGARVALRIDNVFDRRLEDTASEEFDHDRLPREGRAGRISLVWSF